MYLYVHSDSLKHKTPNLGTATITGRGIYCIVYLYARIHLSCRCTRNYYSVGAHESPYVALLFTHEVRAYNANACPPGHDALAACRVARLHGLVDAARECAEGLLALALNVALCREGDAEDGERRVGLAATDHRRGRGGRVAGLPHSSEPVHR